ncbi:MAG TPA: SdrD B-like domain-containing protein [Phnomibacter sp.]|nr:SdrD B-like domain-containing protein [Phnomibacter sp.]
MIQFYLRVLCLLVLFPSVQLQAQLIGGDVNKPVNTVYYMGNNNVGANPPSFTVSQPGSCGNTGSVRIVWNGGTTGSSLRQIAMHGGLQFNGTQVAGSSQNLNSGNGFSYTFINLQPGIYTFSLQRDPIDDNLSTNNAGAGAADDYSTAGSNSIGDQQRCAVIGVIILPNAGNLPTITATAQGASSCISAVGSVTISGLQSGQTYEVASLVGGAYTSTGVIPASGQYVLTGLYPGNYPVRVRLAGTTCYRELNMKVPSPPGIPCYTTDELIDFSPSGTSLITNGNFGTAAGTMPSLAGNAGVTDYTLVTINSGQPQDSRYAIAKTTDNAQNGGVATFTGRLRNLTYPTQGSHIFACLQFSKDHTGSLTQADGTANGFMMVVNANYRTDRALYLSGLNLIAGRTYQFSFWAKNLQPFMPKNKNNATVAGQPTYQPIVPRLGVVVNGIIYDFAELGYTIEPATYTTSTYLTQMGWEQFKVRFTAPVNNASSNVGIYNMQQGGFGNDFLLDDVELYEITYIGDKVWNDLNKNGRQEANEPGMANVTVTLNDGSGNPIKTTVSDAFGNYKFYVPYSTATYSVTFIPPPNYSFSPLVGSGATDATDSDPNTVTGRTANFNLAPGSNQKDIDCGLMFNTPAQYASIGDFVWMDANKNGVQDPGESGISGVVVSLFNSSGILVGSTISDAKGFYRFDRITPGQYRVGVTPPPGSLITIKDIGNDNYDSDVFPTGLNYAQTDLVTAVANTAITNVDIGLYMAPVTKRSIGDKIWNDINNNGLQDAGEPGLPSVQVSLYLAGADRIAGTADDVLSANIITDGFGFYQFNNLDSIPYFIKINIPSGYTLTNPNQGANDYSDSDFDLGTLNSPVVDFANGVINIYHVDGGLRLTNPPANWSTIGDVVWADLDIDGVQDANESLMPSITVTLYTSAGSVVATTATDSLGRYRFVNVAPGNYKLGFSNLPDGYLFTLQDRGGNDNLDSDIDALTGETAVFSLAGGVVNLSFDAGLRYGKNPGTASVGNKVWLDYDKDGVQDEDETGISNVTVTLRAAGPDGIFGNGDDVVYTTVTNSLGEYSFTNLPSAPKYRVEFSNINTSWLTLAAKNAGGNYDLDSDGNSIVSSTSMSDVFGLGEGEQKINVALGLQLNATSNGVVGDRVWLDLNGNGLQDATETRGIPGVTVDLLDASGNLVTQSGKVLQTTTNNSGYYKFYGLANATNYFPRFSNLPQGFKLAPTDVGGNDLVDNDVNGVNGRVTVALSISTAARANMSGDLGLVPLTSYVGDFVWNDVDGDGLQEPGEEGLAGVTVTIYNTNGDPLGSTVTNSMGQYYFFNVTPGSYTLGFSTYPTVMEFTIKEASPVANGSDVNRFTGRTDVFVVSAGEAYTDIDAGLRATYIGQVGDYVWEDRNQDGVQDANEPGISGVTIRLLNLTTGAVIGEAITKGNGFFQFFTVPIEVPLQAQFYNVPGSYSFTLPNQGDGNNDSKVNASGVTISNFTLPYSTGVYNIDAGIVRPIILPVTGVTLRGDRTNKNEVALNWSTLTEINAVECIVERSTNGQVFSKVGKVKAAGNSDTETKYEYVDRLVPAGTLYYRIKVVDRNGKIAVSNVAVLSERGSSAEIALYPNPVKENLYVSAPKAGKYKIDMIASNGQTVCSTLFHATQAGQVIQLKRGNYAAGVYRVSVVSVENNELSKVLPVLFE